MAKGDREAPPLSYLFRGLRITLCLHAPQGKRRVPPSKAVLALQCGANSQWNRCLYPVPFQCNGSSMLQHAHCNYFNQFCYKLPNYKMKLNCLRRDEACRPYFNQNWVLMVNSLFCHSFFSAPPPHPFWVFICGFHIESNGWLDCARRNGKLCAPITTQLYHE